MTTVITVGVMAIPPYAPCLQARILPFQFQDYFKN